MQPEHLTFLNENLVFIKKTFEIYKDVKKYFAVYMSQNSKAYLSFGNTSSFPQVSRLGKNINTLVCVYDCQLNFDIQTQLFTQ